jgi:two-component system CheB/CheR fusion protein
VDNEMRLRRFTATATQIVNLIETDVGRPLRHLVTNLEYEEMLADVAAVLESLVPREKEVRTRDGVWFNMCVMPYRTMDNRIDGAVLTFSSIDEQKKTQDRLKETIRRMEQARELVHAIFDMNPEPMAALNGEGKIALGNQAFDELLGENPENPDAIDLLTPQTENQKRFQQNVDLHTVLAEHRNFHAGPLWMETPEGARAYFVEGRVMKPGDETFPYRILLQFRKAPENGE